MQNNQNIKITKISKVNSVDFITNIFKLYQSKQLFAVSNEAQEILESKIGSIETEITPEHGGGWVNLPHQLLEEHSPAQIIFSSGTQGEPKAVVLSYLSLANVVNRLNRQMKVDSSIREYIGVPVTYSFGLGRCRAVSAAGGQFFIPENGFDISEIAKMLAKDEINAISAVPSLWRILLQQPELIGRNGKKVRWIEIGSQYMSIDEKKQMKALFPNACIVQHYGLTEASRTSLLEISAVNDDKLNSVGIVNSSIEVKINESSNICIKGEHVALGQLIQGEIKPLVNSEGWLMTNDSGKIVDGYLHFLGRTDDLINCSGVKVDPELLERQVNQKLHSSSVIIVGIKDKQRGEGFLAVKSNREQHDDEIKQAVHAALMNIGVNALSSIQVTYIETLPVTDTGKIQRKKIVQQYHVPEEKIQPNKNKITGVINIYRSLFDEEKLSVSDSFQSLGGDSLNYVQASVMLEKYLGNIPDNWDQMTITQLENSRIKTSNFWTKIEMSIFLRAFAILCVVAVHSGVEVLGGATFLLIFLVGFNLARFRLDTFKNEGAWHSILKYSTTLLIPYYLLTIVYFAWNRAFELDVILLYANLIIAKITVIFPFWFVQILIQCLIMIGVLFSFKTIRKQISSSPWLFSYILLLGLIIVRALYPFVWETAHLNDLVPIRFIVHMWLGWCVYLSVKGSINQKLIIALTGVIFALIDTGESIKSAWLIIGSMTLPFIHSIAAPRFLKKAINAVAEATFYIFVFNGILIYLFTHIFKINYSFLAFLAGLIGSMIGWWILEKKKLPVVLFNKLFRH